MATARRPASALHLLSAREVQTAREGDHTDGGGLLVRVRGESASWVLRFTSPSGRRREMGLGVARRTSIAAAGESVSLARDQAHKAREQLGRGLDPIDERDRDRTAKRAAELAQKAQKARERWTLARAAREYHERVIEPSRSDKHSAQWIASLEHHVPASVWHKPIADVLAPELLAALSKVRALDDKKTNIPETLQRVRQRLDAVFEDAIFHGRCTSNPAAAVRRKMRESMPRKEAGQFAALPYREAPALLSEIRRMEGIAARCLEFAVLTVSRTSEALLAEWSEFDLTQGLWTVPAARMKAKEAHTVFLSVRAIEILEAQRGLDTVYPFASPTTVGTKVHKPLSSMAMLTVLGRMGVRDRTTVHGLCRATFSTWANETGAARPDVIEACLAHEESNKVRAAYNRAQFMAERRALLEAWAEYLTRPAAEVVNLRAA
jgi:integrase